MPGVLCQKQLGGIWLHQMFRRLLLAPRSWGKQQDSSCVLCKYTWLALYMSLRQHVPLLQEHSEDQRCANRLEEA